MKTTETRPSVPPVSPADADGKITGCFRNDDKCGEQFRFLPPGGQHTCDDGPDGQESEIFWNIMGRRGLKGDTGDSCQVQANQDGSGATISCGSGGTVTSTAQIQNGSNGSPGTSRQAPTPKHNKAIVGTNN